jgi:hypothetical protein
MSGKTIGIAIAAVVVAFGAAFAIGSATKSSDSATSAPSPVKAFKPDAAQTQLASYEPSGALPAPKKAKKKAARKPTGGGGGGSSPATPTPSPTPSPTPAPRPTPAPAPRPPSSGGGGSGGGD